MNRIAVLVSVAGFLALSILSGRVYAYHIDHFVGEYRGETTDIQGEKEVKRDLSVKITKQKKGFRVEWVTTKVKSSGKSSGKSSTKSYAIDFEPTDRENIYSSAMKANLFGGKQPLDPMKGDPYVWARLADNLLTVHALIVTEEGGYEMLTYDRKPVENGLDLVFTRIKDGVPQKSIRAHLDRVK